MLKTIFARLHQKHRTMKYPSEPPVLPELFRGYPALKPESVRTAAASVLTPALTGQLRQNPGGRGEGIRETFEFKSENVNDPGTALALDMGLCLFCTECTAACPNGAIEFSTDHRLATSRRKDLTVTPNDGHLLARALESKMLRLFGRSLKLREVSAGGCNACEADTNVLGTVGFDLGRFGIQFVASPRHADGIFVTGPVSDNMREALLKTWEAIPDPKIAIACGACAIGGGPFRGNQEVHNGVDGLLPVDLYIPGCPPRHPLTILDGLLRLLNKLEQ